ncbi:MAG: hypothetical protein QOJ81_1396 [Chloroflexota bacterium]|nr:hypothetical protein [Chloroflexota bacterium]
MTGMRRLTVSLVAVLSATCASPTPSPIPTVLPTPTATPTASPTVAPTPIPTISSPSPTGSAGSQLFVKEGDGVSGTGYVIQQADGTLRLCELAVGIPEASPSCGPVAVQAVSMPILPLPGWHEDGGVWLSSYVAVSGTWVGEGIAVATVAETAHLPTYETPIVPCPPPDAGWNPGEGSASARERASLVLGGEVDAHPSLYSGMWAAAPGDRSQATIIVVGVTGSIDDASVALRALYPFDLCLTSVAFSAAELHHLALDLAATSPAWTVRVDTPNDRMRLGLAVVDQSTLQMLSTFTSQPIDIKPLVQPD